MFREARGSMAPGIGDGAPERRPQEQENIALAQHLNVILLDLKIAHQQSAAPERSTAVQELASDYTLYTLRSMLEAFPVLRFQLEQQGIVSADGGWHIEHPFFVSLVDGIADTIAARMTTTHDLGELAKAIRWDIFLQIQQLHNPEAWS